MNIIDKYKLIHWLNIRKTSFEVLNKNLSGKINKKITEKNLDELDQYTANLISEILNISIENIIKNDQVPNYIFKSDQDIKETKRPIKRDNIHFYNYYTLPSPKGYVAPVLIDILCPKDKLPKLNNGHLETAITLSLGPNDIYARFGKKINKTNFCKFKVNKDKKTDWIVGDNYYEPSYCLHTYSRATDGPGKILSYTTVSHIEKIFRDKINDDSFSNLKLNFNGNYFNNLLHQSLIDKGYDVNFVSKKLKIKKTRLLNLFKSNTKIPLAIKNKILKLANLDKRLFQEIKHKEDKVGKYYLTVKDVKKTIRKFKSYKIASIASSTRNPDLYGYYIKVNKRINRNPKLDLMDSNCSHYLVTGGKLIFYVNEKDYVKKINCKKGDAIWVGSFIKHSFYGDGSLAKISDGQNFNYLDKFDLGNLYNGKFTINRARKDNQNWGYDKN